MRFSECRVPPIRRSGGRAENEHVKLALPGKERVVRALKEGKTTAEQCATRAPAAVFVELLFFLFGVGKGVRGERFRVGNGRTPVPFFLLPSVSSQSETDSARALYYLEGPNDGAIGDDEGNTRKAAKRRRQGYMCAYTWRNPSSSPSLSLR